MGHGKKDCSGNKGNTKEIEMAVDGANLDKKIADEEIRTLNLRLQDLISGLKHWLLIFMI